jgi:CubicO group peptidase (beta-lactamase class C family)
MRVNSDTHPNRYANRLQHPPLWGRLLVLCAVILSVCGTPASAVSSSINVRAASASAATLGDPMELEAFIDSVVNKQLEELHIAGAVVVIVKDGQVLLSKGYGSADLEKQIPVNADTTLFLPGSVTKLFTWTAVMQLVEQGKIDLQADVNTYLTTFKIQANYPQPITMLDLMAHTSGFEETTEGILTPKSEELTSLETYLAQHMPRRVYPPGQVPAYSNYGAALAGYIVEQVSGESYEQYIENHILIPLGMEHSSMHQPLPAHLAQDISLGYLYNNGKYVLLPINWIQASPAGALSATGADMGRFMLAHLQDGLYNNVYILKPETARLMHTRSYTFDPALPGWAHGFEESSLIKRLVSTHPTTPIYPPAVMRMRSPICWQPLWTATSLRRVSHSLQLRLLMAVLPKPVMPIC